MSLPGAVSNANNARRIVNLGVTLLHARSGLQHKDPWLVIESHSIKIYLRYAEWIRLIQWMFFFLTILSCLRRIALYVETFFGVARRKRSAILIVSMVHRYVHDQLLFFSFICRMTNTWWRLHIVATYATRDILRRIPWPDTNEWFMQNVRSKALADQVPHSKVQSGTVYFPHHILLVVFSYK